MVEKEGYNGGFSEGVEFPFYLRAEGGGLRKAMICKRFWFASEKV